MSEAGLNEEKRAFVFVEGVRIGGMGRWGHPVHILSISA